MISLALILSRDQNKFNDSFIKFKVYAIIWKQVELKELLL